MRALGVDARSRCLVAPAAVREPAAAARMRRDALDEAIAELAAEPPFADTVARRCCLRGIGTLTAFALTVELGEWSRFRPQSLGPTPRRGLDR